MFESWEYILIIKRKIMIILSHTFQNCHISAFFDATLDNLENFPFSANLIAILNAANFHTSSHVANFHIVTAVSLFSSTSFCSPIPTGCKNRGTQRLVWVVGKSVGALKKILCGIVPCVKIPKWPVGNTRDGLIDNKKHFTFVMLLI